MSEHEENLEVLRWRVRNMENNLAKLTQDVAILNKIMYGMVGALFLVQVILPLLERYANGA